MKRRTSSWRSVSPFIGRLLNIGILSLRSEGKKTLGRYRRAVPPTFASAAGQGFRAAAHEAWLVPVGAVVGVARRLALWPALAVLVAAVVRAVAAALRASPLDPAAAARGALLALGSPRVQA